MVIFDSLSCTHIPLRLNKLLKVKDICVDDTHKVAVRSNMVGEMPGIVVVLS